MKTLSWNCRGLGNPATVRALKKVLQQEKPEIVFLMETKLDMREHQSLNRNKLGYRGCFLVDCEKTQRSRRGGLCMLWSDTIELSLISYSMHHMSFKVKGAVRYGEWFVTGMYGWPDRSDRDKTWRLLQRIRQQEHEEWLCIGDFNEILWSTEKRGGISRAWQGMRQFREAISCCGLLNLGHVGSQFTWSNGRSGDENVKERLDRAMANQAWKRNRTQVVVKHLPRFRSDHAPILVTDNENGDDR